MKLVIIESPYAGDIKKNIKYAKACIRDSLFRGEAPFASHLFYTQEGILRDEYPEDRKLGMEAGFSWGAKADLVAVYFDNGISSGMRAGIERAKKLGIRVEHRCFGPPGAEVANEW